MKDVNKVFLIGRLGNDPIQRETKNGTTVVHFSMATSRRLRSEEDAAEDALPVEETQWHQIVSWGKQGELCAQYLKKGSPVFIEGSIRMHKYTAKDGASKNAFEINADNVSFLGGGYGRVVETDKQEAADEVETAQSA